MHLQRCLIARHVAILSPAAAMTIFPVLRSGVLLPTLGGTCLLCVIRKPKTEVGAWPGISPEVTSALDPRTGNDDQGSANAPTGRIETAVWIREIMGNTFRDVLVSSSVWL